jgi:hypothetical protein
MFKFHPHEKTLSLLLLFSTPIATASEKDGKLFHAKSENNF